MTLHSHVIDARTGQPFVHGGDVLAVYSAAAAIYGRPDPETGGLRLDGRSFDQYRARRDAATVRQLAVEHAGRRDALTGQAGAFPRDLEHIYAEVLGEERRPLNAAKLFRVDGRVPLGARTHTVRRRLGQGDVQVYRGGVEIPVVRGSSVEEQFRVIHLVTSVQTDYFELLSDSFAGRNAFADDSRDAVRFLEERANLITFEGDGPSKVWGVLNYPHLAKAVAAVPLTSAAIIADPAGSRAELNPPWRRAAEPSDPTAWQPVSNCAISSCRRRTAPPPTGRSERCGSTGRTTSPRSRPHTSFGRSGRTARTGSCSTTTSCNPRRTS
jgi:hypothetical protein